MLQLWAALASREDCGERVQAVTRSIKLQPGSVLVEGQCLWHGKF